MSSRFGNSLQCPTCKATIPPQATICPNCGRAFGVEADPRALLTRSVSGDRATGVGIAMAASLLFGGVVSVFGRAVHGNYPLTLGAAAVLAIVIYLVLRIRYPVVAKSYAIAALILYIVIPAVVILGALAICAAIFSAAGVH